MKVLFIVLALILSIGTASAQFRHSPQIWEPVSRLMYCSAYNRIVASIDLNAPSRPTIREASSFIVPNDLANDFYELEAAVARLIQIYIEVHDIQPRVEFLEMSSEATQRAIDIFVQETQFETAPMLMMTRFMDCMQMLARAPILLRLNNVRRSN